MENLFDLIFENFWVVIILFGIVSSLFGGDKKQQNKRPYSETTQMPTMPSKPAKPKQMPQKSYQAKKVQEVAERVESKQQVKDELSKTQAYLAEKAARMKKEAEQMPKKPLDSNQPTVGGKAVQGTFSKNEVVNGIIMAEILGPPRAKKPYSGARR